MGTRADFYVGRGKDSKWLGSIAFDGYPDGIDNAILSATNESEFVEALRQLASSCDHWTSPDQGWPWPWEDSRTTDYAYALDGGKVWASCFGHEWFDPKLPQPENYEDIKSAVFPDMTDIQNVTWGRRSGLIVMSIK